MTPSSTPDGSASPRPGHRAPRVPAPVAAGAVLTACLAVVVPLLGWPVTAAAVPVGRWAGFEPLSGSSRDYTTTMRQSPVGWPAATVTTTSVGGSAVGVQSGAGTFLAPTTPPGAAYGSSRGAAYLNLRPNGLSTAPPSVTTYTFERPTPAAGWTFVLGDIDADAVTVTAVGADGQAVPAEALGFQGAFNYCAPGTSPKPTCGPPNNDGADLPSWLPDSSTLRGNQDARDTAGASGWFEPTVALSSLTFSYAQRSGSPVYQTWFAAQAHDLTGTVTAPDGTGPVTVELFDPSGERVATTTTGADGGYRFDGLASYDGYRVAVVRPDGTVPVGPLSRAVDLGAGDATADFEVRAIRPSPVLGTLTDADTGDPVVGVTVRLTGPGGLDTTAVTGADGGYLFDDLPAGTGYRLTVAVPDDYTAATPTERTFVVPPDSETPIRDQDFRLARAATGTITGTVTATGSAEGVGGVLVTLTDRDGGASFPVRTGADGSYRSPELPPGVYTVTVTAPDGADVVGAASRTVTVPGAGGTVTDQDFVLDLPAPAPTHSIAGQVLDTDGRPLPDAVVTVTPGDGGVPLVADVHGDGRWQVPGLPDDGYEVAVEPPDGYRRPADVLVEVEGSDVTGIEFRLARTAGSPSGSPSSAPSGSPTNGSDHPSDHPSDQPSGAGPTASTVPTSPATVAPSGAGSHGPLASTGGPSAGLLAAGVLGLGAGLVCLLLARRTRRGGGHSD